MSSRWTPDQVLPVELDEHQVPDLQHVGVVHVYQVRGVPAPNAVVVDLAAGAAGARVPHFPEVVLHAAWQDASLLHPEERLESSNIISCNQEKKVRPTGAARAKL